MPTNFAQTNASAEDAASWWDTIPPLAWVGGVFTLILLGAVWERMRRRRGASPLISPGVPTKSQHVPATTPRPFRRMLVAFGAQTLVWTALTIAFAALLVIAGPQPWSNAFRFAALNWMPWVILAPAVFWFSSRFPIERGHLWRSIPAHIIGCATCVSSTLWVATYVSSITRPMPHYEERRIMSHEGVGTPDARPTPAPGSVIDPYRPPAPYMRGDHTDRMPRDGREPFGRRPWFLFGAALLRANFDAAIYLIVVVAAHALAFYRRAQERERHAVALTAGLNRAKLEALRLQLQPHFLFNTLNAISTLVHRDAAAADELIGDLSELLRLSLQTSEHEVPLARELELLDRYIGIEQTRLGSRLTVVREIDPAATGALVPTLILQPIVENAVRHGIEPRLAPGTVTIRARRNGDMLNIAVSDDGVGLTSDQQAAAKRGIGLSNTEARLRTLHGDAATLELHAPNAGGAEIRITLPFNTKRRVDSGTAASQPSDAASAGNTATHFPGSRSPAAGSA